MHDIGQSMLSDMGAVYTLGIQHGTVVRNNLIHDVSSFTYGGWGLYPDEGSTGIVYFGSGTLLGSSWKNERFVIDHNLYFDTRTAAASENFKFADTTLDKWRARGHDTHSLIADPLFVAPDQFDFRLRKDSPALARGFKPIDLTTVGVRPPEKRSDN